LSDSKIDISLDEYLVQNEIIKELPKPPTPKVKKSRADQNKS